ncbi:MAG: hypothetical protein HZA93_23515 [Verrucomicrobia bacterium]|nr:hypothetical protein [Verrucomicrobiota bacterium]
MQVPSFRFVWCLAVLLATAFSQEPSGATLPPGVRAVWDAAAAFRETTPTREKLCVNGLWRWQPAAAGATSIPATQWGHFKVPGAWPGITDYMQKDAQGVFAHDQWKSRRLGEVSAAWYQREITLPATWSGRRITLSAEYVNSIAEVWLDGTRLGEIRFPGGELDLTPAGRPGATHTLSLLVTALPLKAVLLSYADTNTAREVKGRVARRGLCGDVFLVATPPGARIADVKIDPSFRRREIAFDVALDALAANTAYTLEARITREGRTVKTITSRAFAAADLAAGRFAFTANWLPDTLWDLHTPQNTFDVGCTLLAADGRPADTAFTTRFGFREFWIEGRDFYLNGSRLQLSVVPLDNAQVSAALASYAGARESLERLKSIGINFVYTHNYGCEPGSHLGFAEILRAADDVGMLVSFSQPHFSHYDWKAADADHANGYAAHAAFYVRAAQNHPAVVAYAMNHNSTGYAEDMNPDLIDGLRDPRNASAQANAKLALRAEAIVRRRDASRVIYHHSSGNLGAMHTINFYPNFAPVQELSDWFGHWATVGVKPLFLCEYGAPFTWDWTMYRGWYKGVREFGSAAVPWEFCLAEWNAQSSATARSRSARRKRTTSAGRRSSSPPANSGTAGTIRIRSAPATSTSASRSSRVTWPTTGPPTARGASPRSRRGNSARGGSCGPASIASGRTSRSTGRASSAPASAPTSSKAATNAWISRLRATIGCRPPRRRPCCATTDRCWRGSPENPPRSPARITSSPPASPSKNN